MDRYQIQGNSVMTIQMSRLLVASSLPACTAPPLRTLLIRPISSWDGQTS